MGNIKKNESTCAVCGTQFQTTNKRREKTTCSAYCASRWRSVKKEKLCLWCKQPFTYPRFRQYYCSEQCGQQGKCKRLAGMKYDCMIARTTKTDRKKNKSYAHVKVLVNKKAFVQWATPLLYEFYREHPGESPSVDRIDSSKHYEFGNMQMISMKDNIYRPKQYHLQGTTDAKGTT